MNNAANLRLRADILSWMPETGGEIRSKADRWFKNRTIRFWQKLAPHGSPSELTTRMLYLPGGNCRSPHRRHYSPSIQPSRRRPAPSMKLSFHSASAFRIGIPFTSLGIRTSSEILRTSLLCHSDAPRFEKPAHRCSQESFRSEQSFRLRHPLAPSIDYCYLLPNSR